MAAIAGLGFVAVRSSQSVLVSQIDEQLRGIQTRLEARPFLGLGPAVASGEAGGAVVRNVAFVAVDAGGEVTAAIPSGFFDDPDAMPDPAAFDELLIAPGAIASIPAVDGTLTYRAIAIPAEDGGVAVGAIPLDDVAAATSELILAVLLGGIALLVVGAGATWRIVRRGLRPVDRMVETATTIAEGNFTERIPEADPATELGQLSAALNEMLARIDEAFAHEQEAQSRLKEFIADASHELRTPIAVVQGYAEMYRKGALGDRAELDNAMRRIRMESSRMQRLVEDLLLLARLDRGQSMQTRLFNLSGVVRDVVVDNRTLEPERPIALDAPESLMMEGDEQRLAQVIGNLVVNAGVHTPPDTPVSVTLAEEDGWIVLEVVDSGPGIPPGELDRLFDRFHQADQPQPSQTDGSGLGLAIVAAIVESHGGSVNADNQPGRGARFTITLPSVSTSRIHQHGMERVGRA